MVRFVLLVLLAAAAREVVAAGSAAPCGGACFRAARGDARECRGSADGAFVLDRARCLDRDPICVAACLETGEECRDGTGHAEEIAACNAALESALQRCVANHPTQPGKRARCVDRAQLDAYQCRQSARRADRRALAACVATGDACRRGCGPGEPPLGAAVCLDEARAARKAALRSCRQAFQVTASACVDKDATCAQACAATRQTCAAPIEASLAAAVGACVEAHAVAVAACRAGGVDVASCEEQAGATAFSCRLAARDAAAPGLAACGNTYVACVRGCPAGSGS
jgi:hypothetical protein